jgi:hypothetical protein
MHNAYDETILNHQVLKGRTATAKKKDEVSE